MGFGLGKSSSKANSSAQSSSFVDPTQAGYLSGLYGAGQQTFNNVAAQLPGAAQASGAEAQGINREATGVQRQIAGGSNPFIQSLLARSTQENPYLQGQVNSLGADIGRFTQEQLQGVGTGFATNNQFGSGRQGLAEGTAIGRGIEEFQQGATNLRAGDLQNQAGAATAGAGLQLDASQAAQLGSTNTFELGLAPLLAQFGALESFASILGDPTVLGSSSSEGSSKSSATQFSMTGP